MRRRGPVVGDYDLLLVDIDGVVWLDGRPLEEAVEALNDLSSEIGVRFVTNNSTRHRRVIASMLRDAGLRWVSERHVVTSASTLAEISPFIGVERCFVVGEDGLVEELEERGIGISDEGDVCVGLDRRFDYGKLKTALRNILRGGLFLATNEDRTLPTLEGPIPGAGSMVAAVAAACGRDPDLVAGKPNPLIFLMASRDAGATRPLVIGDRPETDILGALRAGMDSALVLTGVVTEAEGVIPRPKYILRSLKDLMG